MQTGKCISNLRHRSPVSACAMSTEMVITGCEDGTVKVWDLKSAELVKVSHYLCGGGGVGVLSLRSQFSRAGQGK